MSDTTVIKVDSRHSPKGPDGQVYLATGKSIAMRMWRDVEPGDDQVPMRREYDCAGYAISRPGGVAHRGAGDPAQPR